MGVVCRSSREAVQAAVRDRVASPKPEASPTDRGSTHVYRSWWQITREVIDARVWEGIHFRFSDIDGAQVGGEIARYDLRRLRTIGL
jgi:hypothetical protein